MLLVLVMVLLKALLMCTYRRGQEEHQEECTCASMSFCELPLLVLVFVLLLPPLLLPPLVLVLVLVFLLLVLLLLVSAVAGAHANCWCRSCCWICCCCSLGSCW